MDEKAYLEQRAEAEIALAQAATHPAAVRSHYLMAGYYLDRVYGPGEEAAAERELSNWTGLGRR